MNRRRRITMLLLVLLMPLLGMGQSREAYDRYSAAAGDRSMLYRGRQATSYEGIAYNGTYFWDSPQFRSGTVCYNGRVYYDVSLNIDSCEQQLLVRYRPETPAVVVSRNHVCWFTIGPDTYVNLLSEGQAGASEGFYKLLSDSGEKVFLTVRKPLTRKAVNANGALIGYEDPMYDSSRTAFFRRDELYYCIRDGVLKRISRHSALKRIQHGQ